MNEQKKKLMLKAAVQFKGVWPDGYEALVVSTETNSCWGAGKYQDFIDSEDRFNIVMGDSDTWLWVCTKQEFEAFIDSLFEGAPYDATHHGSTLEYPHWYRLIDGVWYFREKGFSEWVISSSLASGSQKECDLIPRPSKQESTIDFSLGGEFKKTWSGEGLPPVGVECRFDCTAGEKGCVNVIGTVKYISDYTCVMHVGGSEFAAHPDTMKFRPLKTEAEKEREELYKIACDGIAATPIFKCQTYGWRDAVEYLIDAGWRPSKD